MKEALNDFTKMVERESKCALETVTDEEVINPQPIIFPHTTTSGQKIMIRQEETSVTSSKEIQNVDSSYCFEEVKVERISVKSKNMHKDLDTRNQNCVVSGLDKVFDEDDNFKKCQYMPQDSREKSELLSSCDKQEGQLFSRVKKCEDLDAKILKSSDNKLEISSGCNYCSFISDSSDLSTPCSGVYVKLYGDFSHSLDAKIVSKDKFDSVSQDNFSDRLGLITHHHLQRTESSRMNDLCEIQEVFQPHQSEDEYEHVTDGLVYVVTSFPGSGIDQDEYTNNFIKGCMCNGTCAEDCSCFSHYGCPYVEGKLMAHHETKPIFECNDSCGCSDVCPGRLIQRGPITGLKIVKILGKGYGITTSQFIRKHSFVCEYAGELISVKEAQRRFSVQKDHESNYILILREYTGDMSSGSHITVIDPTVAGNIGRYINHSCDPNLVVVPVRVSNMVPHAALFASKDIFPGEELCYDYNSSQNKSLAPHFVNKCSVHAPDTPDFSVNLEGVMRYKELLSPVYQSENVGNTSNEMSKVLSEDTYPVHFSTNDSSSCKSVLKPCLCKATNCRHFLPVIDALF